VIKRLINRGTADKPNWECEFCPFNFAPGADTSVAPDDRVLMTLLTGRILEGGPTGRLLAGGRLAWVRAESLKLRVRAHEPNSP
jgi:hypothetical protein